MTPRTAVFQRSMRLLAAAAAAAVALAALGTLHQRERHAREAAARATLAGVQLRDAIHEVTTLGAALPAADAARVLTPAVQRATAVGEQGLAGLDAVLADPARTELLHRRLHHLPRLAATTRSPQVIAGRLTAAGAQLGAGAEAIARQERARAGALARATLAGDAALILTTLALAAVALGRAEHRRRTGVPATPVPAGTWPPGPALPYSSSK